MAENRQFKFVKRFFFKFLATKKYQYILNSNSRYIYPSIISSIYEAV